MRRSPEKKRLSPKPKSLSHKPIKPLLSVSRPPNFSFNSSSNKGKEKATYVDLTNDPDESGLSRTTSVNDDDKLWVDRYEPTKEGELVVHKRKVENVRQWFQEALDGGLNGKLRKYRRVLVLTGPAGSAKTATVRMLAREMGFKISEWNNSMEESFAEGDSEREGLIQKFDNFLSRAATCTPLLGLTASSSPIPTSSSSSVSFAAQGTGRQIILLEDLPNVLHEPTQEAFHAALETFVASPAGAPLVIIISDASTRAEIRDERLQNGGGWSSRDTIDIRTVLPANLLNSPLVTQIAFNPVAPTLMIRSLTEMLNKHCKVTRISQTDRPTKADIELIVETSNGDIRSAIMALQFSCGMKSCRNASRQIKNGKKKTTSNARGLMEAVTRREQALHLFHLLGKVLYNKRKGDPPGSSATAKDKAREAVLDSQLREPFALPPWLSDHERRPSRLNVDELYADSPIDTGLLSLYIHQNYAQFCDDLEETEGVCDWLSWIDCSGGEQWYQSNPHQFHLLTLGTIHSLPAPVPRRNQKIYKPEFFEVLKKMRDAEDALTDVWLWFQDTESSRYSKMEIALEMSSTLKWMPRMGPCIVSTVGQRDVPQSHTIFSSLTFSHSGTASAGVAIDEKEENVYDDNGVPGDEDRRPVQTRDEDEKANDNEGGYLSSDDIEDC